MLSGHDKCYSLFIHYVSKNDLTIPPYLKLSWNFSDPNEGVLAIYATILMKPPFVLKIGIPYLLNNDLISDLVLHVY